MAEVENGTLEVDEDQVGTNFFDSACWKTCLKIKTFMLSLWMMCDVVLDVRSCVGFYKQMQYYNETRNGTELFKNDTVYIQEEVKVCIYYNILNHIFKSFRPIPCFRRSQLVLGTLWQV